MNLFQMAWRCVIRKPVKSVLLLLMISVISLLLLSGMASQQASVATQDKTRQAIGAGLLLEHNEQNRYKRTVEICERIGENTEGSLEGVHQKRIQTAYGPAWQSWTDNSFETLRLQDVKTIASVPGVSDYNLTTSVFAVNPVGFSRIEDPDVDQSSDLLGVSLVGNKDMKLDANVLSGNLSLKSGRMVRPNDQNTCVISAELARKNHLSLGDSLAFNDYHDPKNAKTYKSEIIGIYQVKQKMAPFMSGDTFRSENVVFTDLRFPEKAAGDEDDPLFEKAYFQVGNVDDYDQVKEAVKDLDLDWERYDLIDNNGNMDTMSSNFNDLQKISTLLVGIVAIVSFVILLLIFVFWLKNRTQEMGVLFAIGTSKWKIIGQILLEALMIGAIALLVSFALSPAASKITADYLVQQQVQQAEEAKLLDEGNVATGGSQESQQSVVAVHAAVTKNMLLVDGLGVTFLITLSVLTAGSLLLRRGPRNLLYEMN